MNRLTGGKTTGIPRRLFRLGAALGKAALGRWPSSSINFVPASTVGEDARRAMSSLLFAHPGLRGPQVERFERAFAEYHKTGTAFSFRGGRVALYAILKALEVGDGDEVILPGFTCVVVANAIQYCGATPVYVDIAPNGYGLDPRLLLDRISHRTKAIILQHTFGIPGDVDRICQIASRAGVPVVEDCAHALGAEWNGRKVGTFGAAAFYSAEQSKIISTGMGGVALVHNQELTRRLRDFQAGLPWPSWSEVRSQLRQLAWYEGLLNPKVRWLGELLPARWFLVESTGSSELAGGQPAHYASRYPAALAEIGLRQLERLPQNLAHRWRVAEMYWSCLKNMPLHLPNVPPQAQPAYVRFPVRARHKTEIVEQAAAQGIELGVWFSSPIHPAGSSLAAAGYSPGSCPVAERAVAETINLPTHPKLALADCQRVIEFLQSLFAVRGMASHLSGSYT